MSLCSCNKEPGVASGPSGSSPVPFRISEPSAIRPRRGFTIIELMVVVIIFVILAAFILPAVTAVSGAAQTTQERSAARGLVAGWRQWALEHDGRLLPGQLDLSSPLPPSEAPVSWNGTQIPEIARRRWLWRLVPYLADPEAMLWVNDQDAFHENAIANTPNPADGVYLATLHPSFGLNTDFLGGRQSNACDTWTLSEYILSQDEGARPLYSDTFALGCVVPPTSSDSLQAAAPSRMGPPPRSWRDSGGYLLHGSLRLAAARHAGTSPILDISPSPHPVVILNRWVAFSPLDTEVGSWSPPRRTR